MYVYDRRDCLFHLFYTDESGTVREATSPDRLRWTKLD
jgi:hypothetical protein